MAPATVRGGHRDGRAHRLRRGLFLGRRGRSWLDVGSDPFRLAKRLAWGRLGCTQCLGGTDGVAFALTKPVRRAVGFGRADGFRGADGNARADRFGAGVAGGLGVVLTASRAIATEDDDMEDDLVASGRFVRIETRGERTGLARPVTIGFADDIGGPVGAVLVAAGSAETAWARNLLADPTCRVTLSGRSFAAVAEPLTGADHARAIRELILRYGTPAEGLGHGPSFRLRPAGDGAG
jgi:deazaflavin-dependent oxidoreductase (nitroreductase family)